MPQFQPRPMVVIRNQLLAFLVLHLLGSCVPIQSVQLSGAVTTYCCQQYRPAKQALPSQISLNTPYLHSR